MTAGTNRPVNTTTNRHRKVGRGAGQVVYPSFHLQPDAGQSLPGYARYVGRVGALAVALGIGAAVATGFGMGTGVAWAQDGDAGSTADTSSTDPSGDSGPTDSATGAPQPGAGTDGAAGNSGAAGGSGSTGADGADGMKVESSGGLDNSANDGGQSTDTDLGTDGADGAVGSDGAEGTDGGEGAKGVIDAGGGQAPAAGGSDSPAVPAGHGSQHNSTPPAAPQLAVNTGDVNGVDAGVQSEGPNTVVPMASRFSLNSTGGQTQRVAAGGQQPAVTTLVDTSEEVPAGPAATVSGFVTSLVSAFLSPFMAGGPSSPAPEPPLLWAVLGWVTRETQRALGFTQPGAKQQQTSLTLASAAAKRLTVAAVPNTAPVAYNDPAKVIAEDTVLTVSGPAGVLTNDLDAQHNPLTATLVAQAHNGTVTLNPDGGYTYTPNANFYGQDTFTYRANDGQLNSNVATATIAVTPVADPPVGNPDNYVTPVGKKLTVAVANGVLKNDTDVDTPTLTAQLGTPPAHGTLTFTPNGAFTYTPTAGFSGIDTFTYRANGAGQLSDPTTVSIKVGVNNPVANNDTGAVDEGDSTTIDVTANDTDADGNGSIVKSTVAITDAAEYGDTSIDPVSGVVTYTPTIDLPAGQTQTDTFKYTVKDTTNATSNEATVTVTITGVANKPPTELTESGAAALDGFAYDIAASEDATRTYVILSDGTVKVFDTSTTTPTSLGSFDVGATSQSSVAVSADGKRAFVTSPDQNKVSIIDSSTPMITVTPVTADIGSQPTGVAVSADGTRAWVTNNGGTTVTMINATAGATPTVTTVAITVGNNPYDVAVSADGKRAFVSNSGDGTVSIIDTSTAMTSVTPVTVGFSPREIKVSDDGTVAIVYNGGDGSVSLIKTTGPMAPTVTTFPGGSYTSDGFIAISDDGTRAFVSRHSGSDSLGVIDTTKLTPTITDISGLNSPHSIGTNADGSVVQLVGHANGVEIVDTTTGDSTVAPITGADNNDSSDWEHVVVSDDGSRAVITDNFGNITVATYTAPVETLSAPLNVMAAKVTAPPSGPTAKLTVAAVPNTAPVAYNDPAKVIAEDTVLTVSGPAGVLTNDLDAQHNPLTATLVAQAHNGTVTLNPDGGYTYTPNANFYGQDTFTYRANDGQLNSNVATATIAVTPVADPPVGNPDNYVTPVGKKLTVAVANGVLKNDTDVDTPTLTAQLGTPPAHGTLTFTPNGAFTYTPTAGFSGIDTFTYRANGAGQLSDPTTVSIKVGVNNPVANNDTATVAEGATSTPINVLANDHDADGDGSIVPSTVSITSGPSHGTASVGADGKITYIHDGGETISDTITYTVMDTTNAVSNQATVTITVTPVNDAPTAAGDTFSTNEDTPASKMLPGADVDSINLIYAITQGPTNGSLGVSFNPATGAYTYTPNAQDLNVGQTRTDTIKYTVSDGQYTSAEATVNITITGTNDAPSPTNDTATAVEDGPTVTGNVLTNDHDVDNPDADLSVITNNPITKTYGSVTIAPNGDYTYTPNAAATQALAKDQQVNDVFTYTVTDTHGGTANATLTVTITGTNDAPSPTNDTATAVEDGPTVTGNVLTNDHDVDNPDADLSVITNNPITKTYGSVTIAPNGDYTYTPNAAATQVLAKDQQVNDVFTYTVTDTHGGTANATLTVTITGTNDAPVVTTSGGGRTPFTENGGPVAVDPNLTVTDPDSPFLSGATITITNPRTDDILAWTPAGGNISIDPTSTATILKLTGNASAAEYQSALRAVTFNNLSEDPNANNRTVSFTVTDGIDTSAEATKGINVTAVNDAPVVSTTPGATSFTENGNPVKIDQTLSVADVDSNNLTGATITITNAQTGDKLNWTPPQGSAISIDTANSTDTTLVLTGSAGANQYRNALRDVTYVNTTDDPGAARTMSFTVTDGTATSAAATRIVTIAATNDAPTVTLSGGNTSFTENGGPTAVDPALTVADPDNASLSGAIITITNAKNNDALAWTPPANSNITIDAANSTATKLVLTGTASKAEYQTALQSVTFNNLSEDPNASGRTVSFTVTDGIDTSAEATKGINVTAVNDAPVVSTTPGATLFTENGNPVKIDQTLSVADVDSNNLTGATITITNAQTGDKLNWTPPQGSAISIDTANSTDTTLVLTGSAGANQYRNALRDITYVNTTDDPGAARTMSFTVTDGTATSAAATRSVTVAATNDAPVAVDDTASTPEGAPLSLSTSTLTANDTDAENNPRTITAVSGATHGTVSLNANTITYTPAANYSGPAKFNYTVSDGQGGTDTGTVNITVINDNLDDNEIGAVINVGHGVPNDIALATDGKGYIANSDGTVSVINTATNTLIDTNASAGPFDPITLPANQIPQAVAVNASGSRLYVASKDATTGLGTLRVYRTDTYAQVTTIPIDNDPVDIAVELNRIYVASNPATGTGSVTVINGATSPTDTYTTVGTLTNNIRHPRALAIGDNNNGRLYVLNGDFSSTDTTGSGVSGYSTNGNQNALPTFVDTFSNVPGEMNAIAINQVTDRAYVTFSNFDLLFVLNLDGSFSGADLITTVGVPTPTAIAVKGARAYVTGSDGTVSVLNTNTNALIDTDSVATGVNPIALPAGVSAQGVQINSTGTRAYVTGTDGKVYVINIIPAI